MLDYKIANTLSEYETAKLLFKEYAEWLNIDLCFQDFEKELSMLPQMYAWPHGGIILCTIDGASAACVGIRKLKQSSNEAEMKRLYVKEGFRNKGIATTLLKKAEELAKQCGYDAIRLDTLETMKPAMELYQKKGYIITKPYYHNPIETAVYFYKQL